MSAMVQYDLFKETTAQDEAKADLEELRQSHHAVRKRVFGELRALQKMVVDQQNEIDYLKIKLNLACKVDPRGSQQ